MKNALLSFRWMVSINCPAMTYFLLTRKAVKHKNNHPCILSDQPFSKGQPSTSKCSAGVFESSIGWFSYVTSVATQLTMCTRSQRRTRLRRHNQGKHLQIISNNESKPIFHNGMKCKLSFWVDIVIFFVATFL